MGEYYMSFCYLMGIDNNSIVWKYRKLISEHLCNIVEKSEILPSILSDHNIISLSFQNPIIQPRGPGYRKFNISLLRDKNYVENIKQKIHASELNNQNTDDTTLWELIKMDTRTFTIKYCKRTKYKKQQYENSLESKLKILQHRIMNEDDIQEIQEEINAIEQELTSIANEQMKRQQGP